jgi:mxaC protein
MSISFVQPAWLWLAPLCLLPLWQSPLTRRDYSWNPLLPDDRWSAFVRALLTLAAVAAFATLLLGLAGPHVRETTVERTGKGTHIVLLLDRSRSMDDSFAGRAPSGDEESKSAAAVRLLQQFIGERPHDRIGVAAFSTSPLFVLPLTDNRDAVSAAVRATTLPGLAQTHVAKGLALALSYFIGSAAAGSRSILLVSDGAAIIDPTSENLLRRAFVEQGIRLYWIFLRTEGSPGLFEAPPPEDDTPQARPELYLHRFFQSLGIPYRAYEAETPDGIAHAVQDIDQLESLPMRYTEIQPRRDLRLPFFAAAAIALGLLVAAKLAEYRP